MSRKKKNIIPIRDSFLELGSRDFRVRIMNEYQFRIGAPDFEWFYDWYHTTGSLVKVVPDKYMARAGTILTAKEVGNFIFDREVKNG